MSSIQYKQGLDKIIESSVDESFGCRVYLWESVVRAMPGSAFVKNTQGEYVWANTQFVEYLRQVHEFTDSVIGKKDEDIFPALIADAYSKDDCVTLMHGTELTYETSFISRRQKQSWLQVIKKPLFDQSGKILGLIGHMIDVTETRLLAEKVARLQKINENQSKFVLNLSHDIHIPLMGVSHLLTGLSFSISDLLSALGYNPNSSREKLIYFLDRLVKYTKEYVNVAKSSTDGLIRSLDELVDDVHPNSRRYRRTPVPFNLSGLVQSVVDLLQSVAKHKQIKLQFDIDEWLPRNLSGLHFFLHRVLLNLTHYLLSFAEAGAVTLQVDRADLSCTKYAVGDEVLVRIEIHHSGLIARDKWDEAFAENLAVHDTSLGVVKEYIASLHGVIEFHNGVAEGSGFTVTLPLTVVQWSSLIYNPLPVVAEPSDTKQLLNESSYFASLHRASGFSVLLVEDDLITATATSRALYHLGCKVSFAKNGEEALRKASESDYNLIFMDVGLPDLSGIDVTKQIRNLADRKRSQVFIVALTAFAEESVECKRCLEAGMQDVLSKPAELADLKATLDYFVWKTRKQA